MVQEMGLDILQRLDMVQKHERVALDVRLARLAGGGSPTEIFPEYFVEDVVEASPDDDLMNPDAVYDYSDVEWEGPESLDEDLALLQQVLDDTEVTVTADEGGWV